MEIGRLAMQSPSYRAGLVSDYKTSRFLAVIANGTFFWKDDTKSIQKIKILLSKVPFTQFSVECCQSLNFLFLMTNNLLYCDSLILQSIADIDLKPSTSDKARNQLSFSNVNRITKLKIESVTKEEQIQCATTLFPRMECLEITIKSDMLNVITALKCILTNHLMSVPDLRSICFDGENMNGNVQDELKQLINYETLIEKYTLTSVQNRIYFQWNPYGILDV